MSTAAKTILRTQVQKSIDKIEFEVQEQLKNQHNFYSQVDKTIQHNSLSEPLTKQQQNTLEVIHNARSTWNAVPIKSIIDWATLKPMSDKLDASLEELNRSDDNHISITALADLTCNSINKTKI